VGDGLRKVTEQEREAQRRRYIAMAIKILEANSSDYMVAFRSSFGGQFFYEGSNTTFVIGACHRVGNAVEQDCLENDSPVYPENPPSPPEQSDA
jgi:hypothetical protein